MAPHRRIDAVLRSEGVRGRYSFAGPLAVWPPVDIEISPSPQRLVVSPRAEIKRVRGRRLRPDLTTERAIEIERDVETEDTSRSAIVVHTGGAAGIYPPIVAQVGFYSEAVATAAHEWTHLYLGYYPLGDSSGDARAIEETVSDLVGEEVSRLVLDRFGDPTGGEGLATAFPEETQQDFARVMRNLRLEVDVLLASGLVEAAERRMAEVRQQLEDDGIYIRRINQAYFAFFGAYTSGEDSVDPLGDQLREIRERSGSLARFLNLIREVTSREDVEELLEHMRAERRG